MPRPILAHSAAIAACAPYAAWMALMFALPGGALSYAVRSAAVAVVLAASRGLSPRVKTAGACGGAPRVKTGGEGGGAAGGAGVLTRRESRRDGGRCGARGVAAALFAGLAVYALWTLPEYCAFYREWFVIGPCPSPLEAQSSPFDPAVCGWPLALARLAGSAFVIAPAEELFFRHFLYRFLQSRDWNRDALRRFDFQAFAWSVGLFALEHNRPLAAVAAGAVYTFTYIRGGLGAAALAHAATNFVLGVHVLATGAWAFW